MKLRTLSSLLLLTLVLVTAFFLLRKYFEERSPQVQVGEELPAFRVHSLPGVWGPMVRLWDADGGVFCSGSVISDDYILTAAHCLSDEAWSGTKKLKSKSSYLVESVPGRAGLRGYSVGRPVAINLGEDVGLLMGNFKEFRKLKLDRSPLSVTKIRPFVTMTCGFPHASDEVCYRITDPVLSFNFMVFAGGTLFKGMSGGPVYNTTTGEVVGINSGVWRQYIVLGPVVGLFESFGIEIE